MPTSSPIRELFKDSPKSICHSCYNIDQDCSGPMKQCGTDVKMKIAFVQKCPAYNRPMAQSYSGKSISVSAAADSRVEMMGGGHQLKHDEPSTNAVNQ